MVSVLFVFMPQIVLGASIDHGCHFKLRSYISLVVIKTLEDTGCILLWQKLTNYCKLEFGPVNIQYYYHSILEADQPRP